MVGIRMLAEGHFGNTLIVSVVYIVIKGDSQYKWRTEEFRMFQGGSIWRPPQMNPFSQGMPEELVEGGSRVSKQPAAEPQKKSTGLTERYIISELLLFEKTYLVICFSFYIFHVSSVTRLDSGSSHAKRLL